MTNREISKAVDRQLMYGCHVHCNKCGASFHPAWGSCLCPEPKTVECVRCGRTGAEEDESLVDVKDVGVGGDECLYDDDVIL